MVNILSLPIDNSLVNGSEVVGVASLTDLRISIGKFYSTNSHLAPYWDYKNTRVVLCRHYIPLESPCSPTT